MFGPRPIGLEAIPRTSIILILVVKAFVHVTFSHHNRKAKRVFMNFFSQVFHVMVLEILATYANLFATNSVATKSLICY